MENLETPRPHPYHEALFAHIRSISSGTLSFAYPPIIPSLLTFEDGSVPHRINFVYTDRDSRITIGIESYD